MLRYAIIAFIVAIIAAALGFGGIAAGAQYLSGVFFVLFLVLFVVHSLGGRTRI